MTAEIDPYATSRSIDAAWTIQQSRLANIVRLAVVDRSDCSMVLVCLHLGLPGC